MQAEMCAKEEAKSELDGVWMEAEAHAFRNFGEYSLAWKELGYISPTLYTFPERHSGMRLISLKLVGHKLKELPEELGSCLGSLTSLSLSNNLLVQLPDTLCRLTNLVELNLVRNRLKKLPAGFGSLLRLRRLHISGNRLVTVPPSFGNLLKLKRVVLDCNRIRYLPETLGRLRCSSLNLNSNRLATLPRCLKDMPNLTALSVCNNGLRSIPGEVGSSKTLISLRLSSNRLTELPDNLCKLLTLKQLWLEHNYISGLPMAFHRFEALTDLRLDGNRHMVYPPETVVVAGVAAIREWCRKRVADRAHSRRQTIVMTLQDVLAQVKKFDVAHSSLFEPNVRVPEKKDDLFYAVVWDEFWTTILPALEQMWGENPAGIRGHVTSFGYSREEVDSVLEEFRDPSGRIMRTSVVLFRRCACLGPDGNRRVCIPPKVGWMCERRATLIKCSIVLERELQERMRQKYEQEDIVFRENLARKLVHQQAAQREGRNAYRIRALRRAEELTRQREAGKFKNQSDALLAERKSKIDSAFDKERQKAQKAKRQRIDHMKAKIQELEQEARGLQGWAREQKDAKIDQLVKDMQRVPEDEILADIDRKRNASIAEAEGMVNKKAERFMKKIKLRSVKQKDKDFQDLVEELMMDMINRDAEKEAKKARATALEEHIVLRRVMALWLGVGMRETFAEWKLWTKQRIKQRRKDARQAVRQAWHDFEAANVGVVMAEWRRDKWKERWDDYNDITFWEHCETHEVRYERPVMQEFLQAGYVPPVPPTTKLEDLSESENDMTGHDDSDSSESESSSLPSSEEGDSMDEEDESGGASDGEGSVEESEGSFDDNEGNNDDEDNEDEDLSEPDDEESGASGSDADNNEVALIGNGVDENGKDADQDQLALSTTRSRREDPSGRRSSGGSKRKDMVALGDSRALVIQAPPSVDTAKKEAQKARMRASVLRRNALKKFAEDRAMRLKFKQMRLDGIEPIKIPTLEEAMAMTGFDPEADYTTALLTAMSQAAMKILTDAGGSLEGLDRFGHPSDSSSSSKPKSSKS
jgi:hypothetical protein